VPGGWRLGERAWTRWSITLPGREPVPVRLRGRAAAAEVMVGDGSAVSAAGRWDGPDLVLDHDGTTRRYSCVRDGDVLWLGVDGRAWPLTETSRLAVAGAATAASGGPLTSPMPGTVLDVRVAVGAEVTAGTPLLVVEAMKMEHTITAPVDGVVSELYVRAGQQVALDEPLAVVTSPEE
jgi:acetyl-CoA/propionyl-CoA carboxylase biotin carboxyl carrier protein